jgi:hypothetical protein
MRRARTQDEILEFLRKLGTDGALFGVNCSELVGSKRVVTKVQTGLSYEAAKVEEDRLNAESMAANPGRSCWSIPLFTVERETPYVPRPDLLDEFLLGVDDDTDSARGG